MNHGAEHFADLGGKSGQSLMFGGVDVTAVFGKIEGAVGFAVLSVAVGELADEVGRITPLRPGLAQVQTNGARRPTNLARQGIAFLCWKPLAQIKDLHGEIVSLFENGQFFCRADGHGGG